MFISNNHREMVAKTKFSASEAASAMEYMAMAGWKTSDMLNGIEGIMNLAAASGEELATTSDIVTDALTAFGLSAADSGHFADILAAASSNANINLSMMGETILKSQLEDGAVASLKRGRLKITPERIAEAPDLLHFEKGIYCAFMKKGTVKGDSVLYETNFGVTLPTCGNQRTLTSFLGFKKCSLDGLVTLVDASYRVYDNTVQY